MSGAERGGDRLALISTGRRAISVEKLWPGAIPGDPQEEPWNSM